MSGYTALPTKNPGDVLTSALWNTYLQGNADSGFMRMIADSTLVGAQASFDFISIPQTFAQLMLVLSLRGDTVATSTSLSIRMNNDSGANYNVEQLLASNATVSASASAGATSAGLSNFPAASAPASVFGAQRVLIPNYLSTTAFKSFTADVWWETADTAAGQLLALSGGVWKSASAINRLTLLPGAGNFVAGSRATLYGFPQ